MGFGELFMKRELMYHRSGHPLRSIGYLMLVIEGFSYFGMSYILGLYFERFYNLNTEMIYFFYIVLGLVTATLCLLLSPYIHRKSLRFNIITGSAIFAISYTIIGLI